MAISILDLSEDGFQVYGKVIEQPQRATDADGAGWKWWGELVQMKSGEPGYAIGYLDLSPCPLRFDWAERHLLTDELVIPLGGDCLVYVAPPENLDQPLQMPDLDRFQAFRVRQGQAVLLKPGVWHGAPMAIDQPVNAMVLLRHNTAAGDIYINRFEDDPVEITR